MKKIVSLLITAVMLLSLIPFSVFSVAAVESETGTPGLTFTLSKDQTYYIVSDYGAIFTDVVIPAEYKGLPVKAIGDSAFNNQTKITSVSIPNSVTEIGIRAFYLCTSLKSVEFPDSVLKIGDYAFQDCSALTSVVIGDSVSHIGYSAFQSCDRLVDVVFGDSLTYIGHSSFYGCTNLSSINLPDSVLEIDNFAFSYCTALKSAKLSNAITRIGSHAFSKCEGLTSMYVPAAVAEIDAGAFNGLLLESFQVDPENTVYHSDNNCLIETETKTLISGFKNSIIPSDGSVTSIAGSAFSDCTNLTSVEIPETVTSMGSSAFYGCTNLETVTIKGLTTISDYAFLGCSNLTSVRLPDFLIEIDDYAFASCGNLKDINIEDSVTRIGESAFNHCESLTNISIPDSVTEIGRGAFAYCSSLTNVIIPDSVTTISGDVFTGCTVLTDIYCEAESKPVDWVEKWIAADDCIPTIHWGYTSEVAANEFNAEIVELEALIDTDYAEEEWANIQAAIESAKEFSAEGKTVAEIRAEIDALEDALIMNPKLKEFGDISFDDKIDSADYLLLKRARFGTFTLDDGQKARADIDKNKIVDSADYVLVKRIAFGTYVLSDSPVNVALNKTYTGTEAEFPFECPYTANLTDGVASSEEIFNDAWFAFYYNASASVEINAPDGVATITIDLGQQYDDIQSVRMHIWQCNNYNIGSPESVIAYVSDNGTDFDEIGELVLPETNAPDWATLSTEDTSGRYVRLVITTSDTATWTFVNEIEVYA